jgi:bis(5'-nucleosyl)-tetraphosphatase (symmetrical)
MALYLIGDIQGCNSAFQSLLQTIHFSPSRDTLYVLGDMVNRGENSLGVLQSLVGMGSAAQCILGNHDLHLLAVAAGQHSVHPSDTLGGVLGSPEKPALLAWLRQQKMALHLKLGVKNWLLVHAGVLPAWTLQQTLALAGEVEAALQSPDFEQFLHQMYGKGRQVWRDDLAGYERLRVITSALTLLRFCDDEGAMDFSYKGTLTDTPEGLRPWFAMPNRQTDTQETCIAFGHWSALGLYARPSIDSPTVLGLDTGCVWGGELTAYELAQDGSAARIHSARSSAKLAAISAPMSTISQAK